MGTFLMPVTVRAFILALSLLALATKQCRRPADPPVDRQAKEEAERRTRRQYMWVSTMFFPETASWTPLDSMPRADERFIKEHDFHLRKAFFGSRTAQLMKSDRCSVFPLGGEYSKVHLFDVDADGFMDVIYSGGCGEADITILWFGQKNGFSIRQNGYLGYRVLRIRKGKPPRFSSIVRGCCGEPEDEYHLAGLTDPKPKSGRVIATGVPSDFIKPRRFMSGKGELLLRESPEIDNEFNESITEFRGAPVFGNILSKFRPGCTGRVVASEPEDHPRWHFAVLDAACDRLRDKKAPYGADAGWVEASAIKLQ